MKVQVPFYIILFLLLSFLSYQTFPQTHVPEKIQFKHITKETGLSDTYIQCLIQDRKGFIWIGTLEGLHRYDGKNFKVFKHSPKDSNSLGTGCVCVLCVDKSGVLWIGTGGGGLNRYNADKENFTRFLNPEDSSAMHNFILALFEDKTGTIWVGTQYDGLFSFDTKTENSTYYKNIPDDPTSVSENRIWTFFEDSKDNLWVGTLSGGLNKFDRANKKFIRYLHNPNDPTSISFNTIAGIREDKLGNIWIATFGGGLDKLTYKDDEQTPVFKHYKFDPKNPSGLNSDYLVFIHIDENDVLWLGTSEGGLNRSISSVSENTELSFISYKHDPLDKFSLLGKWVSWIYQDNSGLLWIANQGEGLNIINTKQNQFKLFSHKPDEPNSLSSNNVTAIYEDQFGIVWMGTYDNGLNKWDRATNKFTHYKHNPHDHNSISNNRITDIHEDKSGDLWVATYFGGLNKFDRKTEKFYAYKNDPSNPNSIREDIVISIAEDPSGFLWVGTPDNGLHKFDKDKGIFTYIKYKLDDPEDFSSTYAADLFVDRSGLLWVSARIDGIFSYDYQKDKFVHYENDPKNANSLGDNFVSIICQDKAGNYWFGLNDGGLDKFDKENNKFKHYTVNDGLPGNNIYIILEDDKGNLWISTDNGLSIFNPKSNTFRNFDSEDGLPGNTLWSGCKIKTGEFIYVCDRGIVVFHPDSINENISIPPVYITDFHLFNKPVPIGYDSLTKRTILEKSIIECDELELNYDDKVFSLEFAALDYYSPENNRYTYIMDGFDKDWAYTDPDRTLVTYTNLDPGEYFFKVKASDKYGNWSASGASIKIIILPPWWQTTWAYILYILFIGGAVYIIWKVQLRRIRIKNDFEMSKFEARKLHEVDELKSRFFTNISHEFRTPLTLILGPAKQLVEKIKDEKIKSEISMIHRNARKLLGLVNQLLDISKLESGNMKLQTDTENIVSLLKALVLSFTSYAERKRIILKLNLIEDEIIVYLDKEKFEKIITNILSNAFKFTATGGRIEVTLTRHTEIVSITISDTGIGIPKENMEKIFDRFYQVDGSHTREHEGTGIGLSLTKELVELHKGKIEVESKEGKGTTFTVSLPLATAHLKSEEIIKKDYVYETEIETIEYDKEIKSKPEHLVVNESSEKITFPILLITEDNDDVRFYIKQNLQQEYRIIEAVDGEDGWNKSIEQMPDLIVSDVMMPKMDGFRFCEKLKTDSRTSHIPVILLTAKAAKEDKLEGYETGADDYIMKPFDTDELKARIKNLIEQRKRLHEHFQKEGIVGLDQTRITSVDKKFLQKAYEIISQNISNELFSVEVFAKNLSVSRSLLHKKITALTGEPPVEFIRRIRLNKAASFIKNKFGNLSEIALEVGFGNPAYFSECFKKQFGVPPSQYPKDNKD
jgi:signal transduction histidine kinase/ligand-binding sensor domain-containing protein/DNA-binding response OmpR family regulator